jgi:hypothetical protein
MRGQNPQHTGRAASEATEPIQPGDKKLTPAEVEKILAAQIGQWQVKGQLKPADKDPIPYEFTLNVQWKEKGKSINGKGSLEKEGQIVSLFSSKEYDSTKGVFLFRFRDELRPEILSHEQYDPTTQTFHGQQVSPEEPEVTYSFQPDGPDKFIFKMKTTQDGELVSTDESIQTRIATNNSTTEPEPNTPAKKLTVKQASEVMAWEIGKWETKGQGMPAGGQPQAVELIMEARWKEEGKSVEYIFTMNQAGQKVSFFGHKQYDETKGIFIYRSKWGENPETTSHEVHDLASQTSHGQSVPNSPSDDSKTTTITKRIGDNKTQQKLEVYEKGKLVFSQETVSSRVPKK